VEQFAVQALEEIEGFAFELLPFGRQLYANADLILKSLAAGRSQPSR